MFWIGLTGSMGSGKSTVAKVLRDMGFAVVDADQVVHDLMKPASPLVEEIISTFGPSVAGPAGAVDRSALGRLVFNNSKLLRQLEGMIHPKVRDEVARLRTELAKQGHKAAFYDVPLLFEKDMEPLFDFILVVSAPEEVRRARIKTRNNISDDEISRRFEAQLSPEHKERKASAVIRNDGSLADLPAEVQRALDKIGVRL
jgi:dephospho-CoA kinase